MGACTVVRAHPKCSKDELKEWIAGVKREVALAHGNSYSGEWNMCNGVVFHEGQTFKSTLEAEDYLERTLQKWENMIAVPAKVPRSIPSNVKESDTSWSKLAEARTALRRSRDLYPSDVVRRVREGKSALKTCAGCGSKINVKHIHSTYCPVCRAEFLMTPTDVKAVALLDKRLTEIHQKLTAREEKLAFKLFKGQVTEDIWIVGGLCAS